MARPARVVVPGYPHHITQPRRRIAALTGTATIWTAAGRYGMISTMNRARGTSTISRLRQRPGISPLAGQCRPAAVRHAAGKLACDSSRHAAGNLTFDGTPAFEQDWTLDQLGNWTSYDDDGDTQTRTFNEVNEILTISGQADPTYDAAGNLTFDGTQHYTYDAWGRLAGVFADDTSTGEHRAGNVVARYRYDGRGYRVSKAVGQYTGTTITGYDRTDYYYNEGWQVLEERFSDGQPLAITVATTPHVQWLWDQRYIDSPAVRWRDMNADGDFADAGDEAMHYTTDANANVTALVASSGEAAERYVYAPYGQATVYDADWSTTRSESSYASEVLFAGYYSDPESGLRYARNRHYHDTLGRWLQRDPAGYVDGANTYQAFLSSPHVYRDWMGTDAQPLSFEEALALREYGDLSVKVTGLQLPRGYELSITGNYIKQIPERKFSWVGQSVELLSRGNVLTLFDGAPHRAGEVVDSMAVGFWNRFTDALCKMGPSGVASKAGVATRGYSSAHQWSEGVGFVDGFGRGCATFAAGILDTGKNLGDLAGTGYYVFTGDYSKQEVLERLGANMSPVGAVLEHFGTDWTELADEACTANERIHMTVLNMYGRLDAETYEGANYFGNVTGQTACIVASIVVPELLASRGMAGPMVEVRYASGEAKVVGVYASGEVQGVTRAYRAVSEAEYQQILRTGRFEVVPGSVEGKYFADTIEGAAAHGEGLYKAGNFRIIEADLPNNAPSLFKWSNLDGKGPARFLHIDDLKNVTPRPVGAQ